MKSFERRGTLWVIGLASAALGTLIVAPMLFLYLLDLMAGTIAPDAGWAAALAMGLVVLWAALFGSDLFYQRHPGFRWIVAVLLVLATALLVFLAWVSLKVGGIGPVGFLLMLVPALAALYQAFRMIRLGRSRSVAER